MEVARRIARRAPAGRLRAASTVRCRRAGASAKRCRPVVDPIGTLPELLRKLEAAYRDESPRTRYPPAHFQ